MMWTAWNCSLLTVSYTHLDVYKRQLQKQIVNYAKTRAVYVEYRKAGYSKKSVSYTHLDVYKRQPLDSPCYMLNKWWTGAYCRYFEKAVLPVDAALDSAISGEDTSMRQKIYK